MLDTKLKSTYEAILMAELQPAMGCTEPIAIAYAASILKDVIGDFPDKIEARFSGNIIKNVKSVIVPATGGRHGIEVAIAAGLISGRCDLRLQVLSALGPDDENKIDSLLKECPITVEKISSGCSFELELIGYWGNEIAKVAISGAHTNVTSVMLNDCHLTHKYSDKIGAGEDGEGADYYMLNVQDIIKFADEVDLDLLTPYLKRQIELNLEIAEEGLRGEWGANIGRVILNMGDDVSRKARAYAAAGSDARMSGCEKPVCIISGSGNQGITASMPVAIYAWEMGASEEELLRALIVSDLITIHQKTGIGTLSAYCGAISAGVGAGAGICYLHGGKFREVAHTIVNAVAILSGTICDGAKPSCAAKIAMSVEAGIMGFEMWRTGKQFHGGDGIVTKGVENTIKNIGRLAKDGMSETDREIIDIMLGI